MQEYWAEVRTHRDTIADQFVFVASLPERHGAPGGVLCEVAREDAARLLANRTHRLATAEEVQAYRAAEDKLRAENMQRERDRRMLVLLQPEEQRPTTPKAKGDKQ